jgi:hypothetical protein
MITVKIEGFQEVQAMLKKFPAQASRAAEIAIDKTAREVKAAIKQVLPQVFANPVPWTRNSLMVTSTKNHNMQAMVWFKEPERKGRSMTTHYLLPQVEGGQRKLKGFELAMGNKTFVPGSAAKLDRYGNISVGQIKQILSVLGRAEFAAGAQANITARSKKINRKPRDYVYLPHGSGKLPPGVYERYQTGVGFGAKTKRTLPFGEYQKGRSRGRFASVIRARGLRPVLIQTKAPRYSKRLPFYEIANKVIDMRLVATFQAELSRRTGAAR